MSSGHNRIWGYTSRSSVVQCLAIALYVICESAVAQIHDDVGNSTPIHEPEHYEDRRRPLKLLESDQEFLRRFPGTNVGSYKASGSITCPTGIGSAVLLCDSRTIVTNYHVIADDYVETDGVQVLKKMIPEGVKECYYSPYNEDKGYYLEALNVANLRRQFGTRYPGTVGQHGSDWAILRLRDPVPSNMAKPVNIVYLSAKNDMRSGETKKMRLLQVAGGGDVSFPEPYYQLCKPSWPSIDRNRNYFLPTDCVIGSGSSGSGVFIHNGKRHALLAVNASFGLGYLSGGSEYQGGAAFSEVFVEALETMTDDTSCMTTLDAFLKE